MSALTMLLIEDDPETCEAFAASVERMDDLTLLGITADADEAIKLIQDYLPEVILVDLELRKGSGSGLDVLRGLKELELPVRPFVMIVTNSISSVTIEYARTLGADYIISKRQGKYSERYVLGFLRPMKDVIQRNYHERASQGTTPEAPSEKKKRIIRRIHTELNNVGINPKALGYKYLTDGILLTIEQPRQYLCKDIAKDCNKTAASVERAMQCAINRAWQITNIDQLLEHYTAPIRSQKGVPTLTEFVFHYATKIGDEYKV